MEALKHNEVVWLLPVAETEPKPEVAFEGFENRSEKQRFVEELIARVGIDSRYLKSVAYRENPVGKENLLGTWQRSKGEMALFKSLEKLPAEAQEGTVVHELLHEVSPLDERTARLFGGESERQAAISRASLVARQTLDTGVYLNGYHKALVEAHLRNPNEVDFDRLVEETNAIMGELRFTNRAHLEQVSQAQRVRMIVRGIPGWVDVVEQAEQNLVKVIGGIKDQDGLDRHITGVRNWIKGQSGFGSRGVKIK